MMTKNIIIVKYLVCGDEKGGISLPTEHHLTKLGWQLVYFLTTTYKHHCMYFLTLKHLCVAVFRAEFMFVAALKLLEAQQQQVGELHRLRVKYVNTRL